MKLSLAFVALYATSVSAFAPSATVGGRVDLRLHAAKSDDAKPTGSKRMAALKVRVMIVSVQLPVLKENLIHLSFLASQ